MGHRTRLGEDVAAPAASRPQEGLLADMHQDVNKEGPSFVKESGKHSDNNGFLLQRNNMLAKACSEWQHFT